MTVVDALGIRIVGKKSRRLPYRERVCEHDVQGLAGRVVEVGVSQQPTTLGVAIGLLNRGLVVLHLLRQLESSPLAELGVSLPLTLFSVPGLRTVFLGLLRLQLAGAFTSCLRDPSLRDGFWRRPVSFNGSTQHRKTITWVSVSEPVDLLLDRVGRLSFRQTGSGLRVEPSFDK